MKVYVSHSARRSTDDVEWFVVGPQDDPVAQEQQVADLRRVGRTVVELDVKPYKHYSSTLERLSRS